MNTTPSPARPPGPAAAQSRVVGMPGFRAAVTLSFALAVLAVPVAALTSGAQGARGAAFGCAAVALFFVFGAGTTYLAAAYAPAVSLVVALLTYTLQVVVLAVAFVALDGSGLVDGEAGRAWLAGTVIGGTFVWVATLLRSATTARIPLYTSDPGQVKPVPSSSHPGEVRRP